MRTCQQTPSRTASAKPDSFIRRYRQLELRLIRRFQIQQRRIGCAWSRRRRRGLRRLRRIRRRQHQPRRWSGWRGWSRQIWILPFQLLEAYARFVRQRTVWIVPQNILILAPGQITFILRLIKPPESELRLRHYTVITMPFHQTLVRFDGFTRFALRFEASGDSEQRLAHQRIVRILARESLE